MKPEGGDSSGGWWTFLLFALCAALSLQLLAYLLHTPSTPPVVPAGKDASASVAANRLDLRAAQASARSRGEAQQPGWLELSTQPVAKVRWGSQSLGTTPLNGVELPSGAHALELETIGATLRRKLVVEIRANRTTVERINLYELKP